MFFLKLAHAMTDRKTIRISGKRQVTIPLEFYEKLHFNNRAHCYLTDDAIVLCPLPEFYEDPTSLAFNKLFSEGFRGDDLMSRLDEEREKAMVEMARMVNEWRTSFKD